MEYALVELFGVAMAVVITSSAQVGSPGALGKVRELQRRLHMPVMLVARIGDMQEKALSIAEFETHPYLAALNALPVDELEWNELRDKPEEELPF